MLVTTVLMTPALMEKMVLREDAVVYKYNSHSWWIMYNCTLSLVKWLHRCRWQHCGDVGIACGGPLAAVEQRAVCVRSATNFLWTCYFKTFLKRWSLYFCICWQSIPHCRYTLTVLCFLTTSRALGTAKPHGSAALRVTTPFRAVLSFSTIFLDLIRHFFLLSSSELRPIIPCIFLHRFFLSGQNSYPLLPFPTLQYRLWAKVTMQTDVYMKCDTKWIL